MLETLKNHIRQQEPKSFDELFVDYIIEIHEMNVLGEIDYLLRYNKLDVLDLDYLIVNELGEVVGR